MVVEICINVNRIQHATVEWEQNIAKEHSRAAGGGPRWHCWSFVHKYERKDVLLWAP